MSLLAPLGLLLGALAAPLVALYFLRIRRQRVVVPSVLLWRELARTEKLATPFQRFQRNLLLLLQLLLLLLLTGALARPYFETSVAPGRSIVLAMDTTASMGANDGSPTRFSDAKAAASQVLADLHDGDEAMLLAAGPTTDVVVPFTRDIASVRAALSGLPLTEAPGDLRAAVELAGSVAKSRPGVEIVVFSDGGGSDLRNLAIGDAKVKFVPVGRGAENAGIVALQLRRSPVADLERQLFVTVQEFGPKPVTSTVEVYLAGKNVGVRSTEIGPDAPSSMVFDLPARAEGELRVALDRPGDLLDADDEAFAFISPSAERQVVLVDVDALTARALAADPRFSVRIATGGDALDANVDVVVAGGPISAGLKGKNLFALRPNVAGPVRFGSSVDTPAVTGWRRAHPTLRFVDWDGARFARARVVEDAGGLSAIVEGDTGPLVLAGEIGPTRIVELAFDPFETDLPLRVAWPVFVLNTVGWLSDTANDTESDLMVSTGAPFVRRVGKADAAFVQGPNGPVEAKLADGVVRVRDTTTVGFYEIRAGERTTRFAANLLAPSESRIAPRQSLELSDFEVTASKASLVGRREIWRELVLVAIGLLLIEWFAWNRRSRA